MPNGMDANALRQMGDFLRDKEPKSRGVLASVKDGKITFLAVCGKEAVASGVKAGDIIKMSSRHLRRQGRRQARQLPWAAAPKSARSTTRSRRWMISS